jgi:phosphopantetheinyl transferase (holo-ACP synthase)
MGRDGDDLAFEVEAVDPAGRVAERVSGLVLSRAFSGEWQPFDYPIAERLRCHPERVRIAELLGLVDAMPLTGVSVGLVESAAGHGGDAFLGRWLSPAEREHYDGLKHAKRRREWLAGRFAAKACLRYLPGLQEVAPSEIEVLADENGVPHVTAPGLEQEAVLVTIAHSDDRAVAACAEGTALGVDVERTTAEIERIADQFCTEAEAGLVSGKANLSRRDALMTIWVAKEAALKVFGAHTCLIRDVAVSDVRCADGHVVCTVHSKQGSCARAVSLNSNDYFYAVAAPAQDRRPD